MEENEVKSIIDKANKALEEHDFENAKKICEEGLMLDCENPNLYLIQLLADYKVTEIAHLKDCEIDFYSDNYKNLRFFADEELSKELDSCLFPEKASSSSKTFFDFFKAIFKTIKNELAIPWKTPSSLSEFCKRELKEFYLSNKDRLYLTNNDTVASVASFSTIITNSIIIMLLPGATIFCLSNKDYFSFILLSIIGSLFLVKLKKVYEKTEIKCEQIISDENFVFFKYLIKIVINTIFVFLCIFFTHLLYISSYCFMTYDKQYILGFVLGILPAYIFFFQYQKIYNLVYNLKAFFYWLKNK